MIFTSLVHAQLHTTLVIFISHANPVASHNRLSVKLRLGAMEVVYSKAIVFLKQDNYLVVGII